MVPVTPNQTLYRKNYLQFYKPGIVRPNNSKGKRSPVYNKTAEDETMIPPLELDQAASQTTVRS